MKTLYNSLKLSEYRALFLNKRVLVVGAGAVGSYTLEFLAKLGVSPDCWDFDTFTLENAAKASALLRIPEDAGRNKALCIAERLTPFLDEGCTSNGIDANVNRLGPEAYSDFDYVILALDNYNAKCVVNENIRKLTPDKQPVVIMAGTKGEMAQSVILDNKEFCLRCLFDEAWMEHAMRRTSCSEPVIIEFEGKKEITRTSNLASSFAAHLAAEQLRASVIGTGEMNVRLTYNAYPHVGISAAHPMKKRRCPGCAIIPRRVEFLVGTSIETTLSDAFDAVAKHLGTYEFELLTPTYKFGNTAVTGFIDTVYCRDCGKPVRLLKHEALTTLEDLVCEECKSGPPEKSEQNNKPLIMYAFSPSACPDELRSKTLFDLGYPLGAHIEAVERNGAISLIDEHVRRTIFAFDGDRTAVHSVKKLL